MIFKVKKDQDQKDVYFSITVLIIGVYLKIYQFQKEKESFNRKQMIKSIISLLI